MTRPWKQLTNKTIPLVCETLTPIGSNLPIIGSVGPEAFNPSKPPAFDMGSWRIPSTGTNNKTTKAHIKERLDGLWPIHPGTSYALMFF